MRLTASFLAIFLLLSNVFFGQDAAQEDLVNTKHQLFPFRHVKLTGGFLFDVGKVVPEGVLPLGYEIRDDSIYTSSYRSLLFLLDLYSTDARLSFSSGAEYNNLKMLVYNELLADNNEMIINHINVPFFIKYKFGKKFSASNVVTFLGGSYNFPIIYKNNNNSVLKSEDLNVLQKSYTLSAGIALQLNLNFRSEKEMEGMERTVVSPSVSRLWIFFRMTRLMSNVFNVDYQQDILNYGDNHEINYTDMRYCFGLGWFIRPRRKHSVN